MERKRRKRSRGSVEHEIEQDQQSSDHEAGPDGHPEEEGSLIEEQYNSRGRRIRRKIKIRKRVRIKRKVSPKKKVKRVLELIAWILVFASFIVTIVILVLQLDLNSKHRNKKSVYHQVTPHTQDKFHTLSTARLKPTAPPFV